MNANEVIAHIGMDDHLGLKIHPNDHVNMSQSSNDTFPTAMNVAAVLSLRDYLYPSLEKLTETLKRLEEENMDVIKIGRTHLQDAVPISFGQEISGWRGMLEEDRKMLEEAMETQMVVFAEPTTLVTVECGIVRWVQVHKATFQKACTSQFEITVNN
jgi:fumarate hydratase class II